MPLIMSTSTVVLVVLILSAIAYQVGRARAVKVAGGPRGIRDLHSLPAYYGMLVALWCAIPAFLVLFVWHAFDQRLITELVLRDMPASVQTLPADQRGLVLNDVKNVMAGNVPAMQAAPEVQAAARRWSSLQSTSQVAAAGLVLCILLGCGAFVWRRIAPELRARNSVERIVEVFLIVCSLIAILTTLGIVVSVLYEALLFFRKVSILEFLFGTQWSPQMAIRADQVGSSGAFGAVPLFAGTLLIALIAMLVAVPIGLFSAIYLSEYADRRFRATTKPFLEVLAGIPTVVYGFFAALTVGPLLRAFGESLGLQVASESALAAGLVMGIMIIPFVSSLADDMITAVPQALRDGAYALGATRSETIRQVVLPAALPGIVGGILLAVSRAIGETMIVVMAAGLAANLTANPFEAVTTVTVQIVTLLVGDQEFDSPKTLAAFALGLVLFIATLILNVIALHVVRKYREQYE
jgi:phosphate transport system permease protein